MATDRREQKFKGLIEELYRMATWDHPTISRQANQMLSTLMLSKGQGICPSCGQRTNAEELLKNPPKDLKGKALVEDMEKFQREHLSTKEAARYFLFRAGIVGEDGKLADYYKS